MESDTDSSRGDSEFRRRDSGEGTHGSSAFESSSGFAKWARGEASDAAVWRLVDHVWPELVLYARHQIGRHLQAAVSSSDLVQDAMVRVMKALEHYRLSTKAGLLGFLRCHIRRAACERGRKGGENRRAVRAMPDSGRIEGDQNQLDPGPTPASRAANAELIRMVRAALESPRMPRLYREVLTAILLEGRDRKELAKERQVREDTLRRQYNRGRRKLRELLGTSLPSH